MDKKVETDGKDTCDCYVILVVYSPKKLQLCMEWLEKTIESIDPLLIYRVIVVNTYIEQTPKVEIQDGSTFLYPGNEGREFGGWDCGIKYVKDVLVPDDKCMIVCANDTFCSNYGTDYLSIFSRLTPSIVAENRSIYGYTDGYPMEVTIDSISFRSWIRTNIFITNYKTLVESSLFDAPEFIADIFTQNGTIDPDCCRLSENYKSYLHSWLLSDFESRKEFPQKWHSARPLIDYDADFLKGKMIAIIREQRLTWLAAKNGIEVVALNR